MESAAAPAGARLIGTVDKARGAAPVLALDGFPHPVYRSGFALAIPIPLRFPDLPILRRDQRKVGPGGVLLLDLE